MYSRGCDLYLTITYILKLEKTPEHEGGERGTLHIVILIGKTGLRKARISIIKRIYIFQSAKYSYMRSGCYLTPQSQSPLDCSKQ